MLLHRSGIVRLCIPSMREEGKGNSTEISIFHPPPPPTMPSIPFSNKKETSIFLAKLSDIARKKEKKNESYTFFALARQ